MESQKPILFYHANCPDGFGAAWAFHKKYGDKIEYHPVSHNKDLPFFGLDPAIFKGRSIWMADISLSKEECQHIHSVAKEFQIIDHHLSAQDELKDLTYCQVDLSHSGAILAWQYCFPQNPPPLILSYVEDRDIWKWKMAHSQEVLAYIDSFDRDFPTWYNLERELESNLPSVIKEGGAILRYNKNLRNILMKNQYMTYISGYLVPIINVSFFKSEILNDLSKDYPFAAGYHYDGKNYIFSLRSRKEGVNVAEIAERFGGGGHFHAAGFSVSSLSQIA